MLDKKELSEIMPRLLGWETHISDYVLDPIYGPIGLTDLELKLIQNEVFTRLKNIKQLGFVSYIYPSATHTRFEHSIGTLFITWEMMKRLFRRFAENNDIKTLSLFTDDVIQSLRIAALMHDLGHGPFSHSLEIALKYLDIDFEHDDLTSYLLTLDLEKPYKCKSIESTCQTLEQIGNAKLLAFRQSLNKLLKSELRVIILSILNNDFESDAVPKDFKRIHVFLHEIIKGDIGSDRIDYLLRDTYFTGLGHKFSLSEIMDNLYYILDEVNGQILLSIKQDGKAALELMLLTRYFHYQFIAHHPQNVMMTALLQQRIMKYLEEKKATANEDKQKAILDIALSSDWIEKDFPLPESFSRIHRVTLLDFQNLTSRFLFYRIIEDTKLRAAFQIAIKKYISDKFGVETANKILFDFTVENPRIPILHFYMEKYLQGAVKRSVLVHDNSPFLIGLGRAYIENSSMTIYATSELDARLKEIFSLHPDFYKDEAFLKQVIGEIMPSKQSLKPHDYLLFMISSLARLDVNRTVSHFSELCREYKIERAKIEADFDYKIYDKCYDPEEKKSFDYPSWLFNSLIVFDVCRLVDLELTTSPYKAIEGKVIFKPTYSLRVRQYPSRKTPGEYYVPLYRTTKDYPKTVVPFL
jgi:HD superfamily phosphohydrolase